MDCAETRDRLVALDDGELGRSEGQATLDHLASCAPCRDRRALLQRVTPRPHRAPPPAILARLQALDVDAVLAAAPSRPGAGVGPQGAPPRLLGRRVEVPLAAVMLYAFALAAVTAWGLSNWWANTETATQVAEQRSDVIPGPAWRPAAYTPPDAAPTAAPADAAGSGAGEDVTHWH